MKESDVQERTTDVIGDTLLVPYVELAGFVATDENGHEVRPTLVLLEKVSAVILTGTEQTIGNRSAVHDIGVRVRRCRHESPAIEDNRSWSGSRQGNETTFDR